MNLFKSRFAKLEAYVNTEESKRTPDMLALAQAELDAAGAKLVLVPHNETVTSAETLQKHIDGLERSATDAKAAQKTAEDTLAALKGKRMLDSNRETPDAGNGGDDKGQETPDQKEAKAALAQVQQMPHYQKLARIMNQ